MKKNDVDYKVAMLVVDSYWHVEDRISKLEDLGYVVTPEWVKSGGVGTIRRIRNSEGVQISAAKGGNNYVGKAYVAFRINGGTINVK